MTLRLTILGCGSSGGVPRIGGDWGECDPDNPKNRRLRCSALVERTSTNGKTCVLIDTSPDCRQQLLNAGVSWLDGVLYTHDHADHTHGIDDLRMVSFNGAKCVDVYCGADTGGVLQKRFGYCFETLAGSSYRPILNGHEIRRGEILKIDGAGGMIAAMPFRQGHGNIDSFGFRIGDIAYSPDIKTLPNESMSLLEGLDVWIVDALRYTSHPTHFNVKEALEAIARVKPNRAILTHMTGVLDHDILKRDLPNGVEPAFDGMVLEITA